MNPAPLPPLPAPRDPGIQAALDADHLRLLEIGFYISGVVTALRFVWIAFMGAIFLFAGLGAAFFTPHPSTTNTSDLPPAFVFTMIGCIFGVILFLMLIFICLEIYAARCLKNRRHPVMIQVIAALYCLSLPWGTALGVCTFMVLSRDSVKALFRPSPL